METGLTSYEYEISKRTVRKWLYIAAYTYAVFSAAGDFMSRRWGWAIFESLGAMFFMWLAWIAIEEKDRLETSLSEAKQKQDIDNTT